MSDANLFAFGCVVGFVALGGAYVYLRERFRAESLASEEDIAEQHEKLARNERSLRDVA